MNPPQAGVQIPSLETLASYHPQVALAVWNGFALRPNLRPVSVQLQNSQLRAPQPVSFSEVMSVYSIFSSVSVTIDPTGNLNGNPYKYISDAVQPDTSGITVNMLIKSNDGVDWAPIPDETPLQCVPAAFAGSSGLWAMKNPENLKLFFTLQSAFQGPGPITVWTVWTFLMLQSGAESFMNMKTADARAQLVNLGILRAPRGG
jgi:hypothetical protein